MEDVYTIADLARKTGLSQAKVKNALKGVEPSLTASDGYFKLYSYGTLLASLRVQNYALLAALGYVPGNTSEDGPATINAEVSE